MSGLMDGLNRIRVEIASTSAALQAAMVVRRAVYVEEMGSRDAETLVDELDAVSTHFLGSMEATAVCSARMVPDKAFFEGEHYFDISDWRRQGRVVEIARLSVLPAYRRSLAVVALFRAFYRYAPHERTRFFFVTGAEHVDHLYRSLGFRKIGGPIRYEFCRNISSAYILDLDAVVEDWHRRRPRLQQYFQQPIEGIG